MKTPLEYSYTMNDGTHVHVTVDKGQVRLEISGYNNEAEWIGPVCVIVDRAEYDGIKAMVDTWRAM